MSLFLNLRTSWLPYLPVALAIVVAIALRAGSLRESLWLDELHTAWVATGPPAEIVSRSAIGNQSPLYPGLKWCLVRVGGANELSLRLFSLLSGIALVPAMFVVARHWSHSLSLGSLGAWLVAIDPHSIYFSQEARPYATVQLVGFLQVVALATLLQRETWKPRACFVGLTVLLFYLHYTSLILLAGEASYLLYRSLKDHSRWREHLTARAVDAGIVLLCTVPAWPHLLAITERRTNWASFVGIPTLAEALGLFRVDLFVVVPLLVVISIAVLSVWTGRRYWNGDSFERDRFVLIACSFVVPLAVAWCLTELDLFRVFFRRYLMVIAALPMLAACLLGTGFSKRWMVRTYVVITSVVAAVFLLPPQPTVIDGTAYWHSLEDWRGAIRKINEQDRPQWPILSRAGLIEDAALQTVDETQELQDYCLFPLTALYRLEHTDRMIHPLPSAGELSIPHNVFERIEDAEGAWFVLRGGPATTELLRNQLLAWLQERTDRNPTLSDYRFGRVTLFEIHLSNN